MSALIEVTLADRGVDVAFEVAEGETVALLGPNGAGKSTALAVLAGLLRPDTGRVVIDGEEVTGPGRWVRPHARRTALLAQEALLFPHLTVLDNVAFGPRSTGAGRREARTTAERWLSEVDASELAGRRPAQLSGGQAQRVAVARALAAEPRLLLLDEPMAALDISVAPALRQLLRKVLADRTTVIVTHHVLDALLLADRVVVMDGGRIAEQGPADVVLSRPRSAFAARFAGLNLVAGLATPDGVRRPDGTVLHGTLADPRPTDGSAAVAVFRPSAVAVHREAPGGSPRNAIPVQITELEPIGDVVRIRAGDLAADVTLASVAELALAPGVAATFVVKATEVDVYAH
ncbi:MULTISPECIES: sulfate/molybdate ABC transporter ATP-binding protein [unclassified Nocardioides]|uniref:sulfate/molybdate ABC transporter ATP-binding protein n=1 Tax=unclassified Nocardioides TaxID=2615069 RepID=UPI0006FD09B9|nr:MULTISPECIES: ABC transporter ATP-binding protein [unclassified Nocardioides]KRA38416.1 molybdenum ABC transporter ATP-binding protein [Nocardioides sp. Root614]KRA92375.1 molybdenum ABC transporter ATP-binding protein [Nocardioides sp. Root682]